MHAIRLIGEIHSQTAFEVIELLAADDTSLRAAASVARPATDDDFVRFIATSRRDARASREARAAVRKPPAMIIELAELRDPARTVGPSAAQRLVASPRPHALSLAVIAVEAPLSAPVVRRLAKRFDAFLPVVVPRGVDAHAPLARAVRLLTSFATADCVSTPIDESYPFFLGAGRLFSGRGEALDLAVASARALNDASLSGGIDVASRMLIHVDTTQADLPADLLTVATALKRMAPFETMYPTASTSAACGTKAVSIVVAGSD